MVVVVVVVVRWSFLKLLFGWCVIWAFGNLSQFKPPLYGVWTERTNGWNFGTEVGSQTNWIWASQELGLLLLLMKISSFGVEGEVFGRILLGLTIGGPDLLSRQFTITSLLQFRTNFVVSLRYPFPSITEFSPFAFHTWGERNPHRSKLVVTVRRG